LNAAVFDSVMVALAQRLERGDISDIEEFKRRYHSLLSNEEYEERTQSRTADESSVEGRLRIATRAFADVE